MEIDFYSKQQTDSKLDEKANSDDVYKKNETYNIEEINNIIDTKIAEIQIPDVSDFYTKSEVYTKTQVDNLLTPKANANDVYNKTQVDNLVSPKANSSDVYNKTETYTKTEVNNLVSPKANSSDVYGKTETYTKTEVNNLLSPKANSSDVYAKSETYNKTEVNGLINNLPVYSGLIITDISVTPSAVANSCRLTFNNAPTIRDGDIIVVRGEFYYADSYTIIPILIFQAVKVGSIIKFNEIRTKNVLTTSGDYDLLAFCETSYVDVSCYVNGTKKSYSTVTNYKVSLITKGV